MAGSLKLHNNKRRFEGNNYAGGSSGVSKLLLSPSAPANLQASNTTSRSTKLTWDAVSSATSYNIYENGGNTAIATATSATYMVSALTPHTSYTFTASALNAAGESAQSSAINVMTRTPTDTSTGGASAGIMIGMPDRTFSPQEYATRAQAAAILKRFLQDVHFID